MTKKQRRRAIFALVYLLIAFVGIWLFQDLVYRPRVVRRAEVPYSQFRQELEEGRVNEVTLNRERITYSITSEEGEEETFNVVPTEDSELIPALIEAGVTFGTKAPPGSLLIKLMGWIIPLLPLALIGYFLYRLMGRGGSGLLSLGKSKAQEVAGEMTGIRFDDVGGVEEIQVELKEIIEFLKDPDRFTRLGAKLPKGILMVGPPGTGKTMLARATAGEAGVPFFFISGSDFVEMYVGVGAARVRDMFAQAKAKAPCIIFIDEIDAIGRSRQTAGAIRTNDEREQTLNQLLSEMDGFEINQGVLILAGTNRPEVLDRALLRPGRFDREIQVTLPNEVGRREILRIHTRDVPLEDSADLYRLAQITSGFSGADLANIVNEAALLAVRRDSDSVAMEDFDLAIERVVAGLKRRMPLKDEVKRRVAYHEGGHALVACLLPNTDPVHKVSIIPTTRGALGYTLQMPEEDQYLIGAQAFRERMAVMMGGRAAELLLCGESSTGAANDLERATDLARRMAIEFGMTEALGPVRYAAKAGAEFLGTSLSLRQGLSPETTTLIDQEIRRLVEEAQELALSLLGAHEAALEEIGEVLQAHEVISGEEVVRIAQDHMKAEVERPG
jgi:cell division protease FtsH